MYVCVAICVFIYLCISDKIMNMWKAQCHKPTIWEWLIIQTTAEWRNEEQQKTYGFSKQHC